jgi:RNA polymerase sigma factor (sigma-70 family)
MPSMAEESVTPNPDLARNTFFPTTHWSVVLRAGESHSTHSQEALTRLCETYRPPVFAYAKGLGLSHADAEDAAQDFFVHFFKKNLAGKIEPRDGVKFRSFLLRCFKNFLADKHDRLKALKRGGGQVVLSLDAPAADGQSAWEPAVEMNAAKIYEREWATALLNHVLDRLEGEYLARGRRRVFERLQSLLLDKKADQPYSELATELGVSEDAVKKEVSRMRQRYRELFREEVAHTVTSPVEVEEEIAHLFAVLSE